MRKSLEYQTLTSFLTNTDLSLVGEMTLWQPYMPRSGLVWTVVNDNSIDQHHFGSHCFVFAGAPTAVSTTCKMEYGIMSMTWKQPDNNGANITLYKVYQRKGKKKDWEEIKTIEDNSTHKYVVSNLEKGEWYEFVITATNKYGESLKEGSCARVKVRGGRYCFSST